MMTGKWYRHWLIGLALGWAGMAQAAFDHQAWTGLLQAHVRVIDGGQATQIDYAGVNRDRQALRDYLAALAAVSRDEFEQWSHDEQLAFLINVYNAWTVELILTEYPDLDSIRDIGGWFGSPWGQDIVQLFGERFTLDNIEHDMIRSWDRYNNPLIHFAVNCASIGCPALRNEAYTSERLQAQLQQQTRLFLMDRSRNYLEGRTLYLSSIFRWYPEDFEQGWMGFDSVQQFIMAYASALDLSADDVQQLEAGRMRTRYLRYDWSLNDVQ
jgi:hypothetical protein